MKKTHTPSNPANANDNDISKERKRTISSSFFFEDQEKTTKWNVTKMLFLANKKKYAEWNKYDDDDDGDTQNK